MDSDPLTTTAALIPLADPQANAYGRAVTVIDPDGNVQTFQAHYWRYHCEETDDFDTPEDAQSFLRYGEDDGALSACCIIWPDGRRRAYDYVGDKVGEDWLPPHDEEGRRRGIAR